MLYNSIEEMVGNTPLMRAKKYEKLHGLKANILVKIEKCNPAGSVKDRVALYMIRDAEKKGLINKDTKIIEPTSGNTG
ncbi:MAG: pyridoxal-phosphate dependent enzyme, partial [Clostridia bacterium]|nr:pyridoxal-phosphate dependent enzyme [Clostridia bacterium]